MKKKYDVHIPYGLVAIVRVEAYDEELAIDEALDNPILIRKGDSIEPADSKNIKLYVSDEAIPGTWSFEMYAKEVK